MKIDELKSKGILNLKDASEYANKKPPKEFFIIPDTISNVVADIINRRNTRNAIVLNSHFGEISSKLKNIHNIVNIDIDSNNIEIAKYFNPNLTFINKDPLNYSSKKFDNVISFPPLGERIEKNGRRVLSGILYTKKSLNLLDDKGKMILIVSDNFLTAPIYNETRNFIIENFALNKIITFTKGILINTGISLSILEISKESRQKTDFYNVNSNFDIKVSNPNFSIPKKKLKDRWDFNFHNPENQKYQEELKEYKTQKIDDLVDVYTGPPFNRDKRKKSGEYKILSPRNIQNGVLGETSRDDYIEKIDINLREENAIVRKGDILLPRFNREKISVYIHPNNDNKYIANHNLVILRGKNAEYVTTYLNTDSGLDLFNQQIDRHKRGSTLEIISLKDLKNIQIPILPIEDLEYASKSKLEELSYDELLRIKNEYDILKVEYSNLRKEKANKPFEEQLQIMDSKLDEVLEDIRIVKQDIKDIKDILSDLLNDFKDIKNLRRDIDEKISRMNRSIDNQLSTIFQKQDEIDFYIQEIKRWFNYYEHLETKSQKYLPEAEFIYDKISTLENPDYSPFIIQYCRAFENELLTKIFRSYVKSIVNRNLVLQSAFEWDFQIKENGNPNDDDTYNFVKNLNKYIIEDEEQWFFELGTMEKILRRLTGKTVRKSPFLQDLNNFVLEKFDEELLNRKYFDEIKTIINDYRNQSAHPNLMGTEKALEFHKQMKKCLIKLMENYKKG